MKLSWGTGIFIFLIIFLILSTIFIFFSYHHNNDLVTDDYYEQGADYSNQIEVNKRSAIYSDSIQITEKDSLIETHICKYIQEKTDSIELFFFRPSDKQNDYSIKYPAISELSFNKSHLVHGRYIVKISWKQANNIFNIEKDFFVK